jgi:hypothetical protein
MFDSRARGHVNSYADEIPSCSNFIHDGSFLVEAYARLLHSTCMPEAPSDLVIDLRLPNYRKCLDMSA